MDYIYDSMIGNGESKNNYILCSTSLTGGNPLDPETLLYTSTKYPPTYISTLFYSPLEMHLFIFLG